MSDDSLSLPRPHASVHIAAWYDAHVTRRQIRCDEHCFLVGRRTRLSFCPGTTTHLIVYLSLYG